MKEKKYIIYHTFDCIIDELHERLNEFDITENLDMDIKIVSKTKMFEYNERYHFTIKLIFEHIDDFDLFCKAFIK